MGGMVSWAIPDTMLTALTVTERRQKIATYKPRELHISKTKRRKTVIHSVDCTAGK